MKFENKISKEDEVLKYKKEHPYIFLTRFLLEPGFSTSAVLKQHLQGSERRLAIFDVIATD